MDILVYTISKQIKYYERRVARNYKQYMFIFTVSYLTKTTFQHQLVDGDQGSNLFASRDQ